MKNEKLKEAREKAGLTQVQVADRVKISEISYQRIEYGKQYPRLETAFLIASVLHSSIDELFQDLFGAATPSKSAPPRGSTTINHE